jgi:hypothetical protein
MEDSEFVITWLRGLSIRWREDRAADADAGAGFWPAVLAGGRLAATATITVPAAIFSLLPSVWRENTQPLRLVPVLTAQGINEQQTESNRDGSHTVQDRINRRHQCVIIALQLFRSLMFCEIEAPGLITRLPSRHTSSGSPRPMRHGTPLTPPIC